jgi:hypothetical protein
MKNGRVKSVARVQITNHSQLNESEVENFNLLVSTSVAAPVSASSILLNANKVVPDTLIETVDVRVNQYSMLSRFEIGFKIALNAQVNHIVSATKSKLTRVNQSASDDADEHLRGIDARPYHLVSVSTRVLLQCKETLTQYFGFIVCHYFFIVTLVVRHAAR